MKHKSLLFFIMCMIPLGVTAQTQQGYVKTLGRPEKKGEALGGVIVRVKGEHNTVTSNDDGTFSMLMTDKKNGDAYSLQQVQKNGYELNENDIIGRQFAFSDKVRLEIVMVSSAQLQADKQRIENNAFKTAEKNYKAKYNLLEKQLNDNKITAEQYREEIQDLQEKFEKYQSLIDGLAEHYAHTDYDELDEKDREINICIENGNLERADSLIHTLFDPIDVLQRNKDALAKLDMQIDQANAIIAQANEDMAAVLKQQEKNAEYLYQLYTIALARYDNEMAQFYIETRAALDTTNVQWQNKAGQFYSEYIVDYKKALYYYQHALRLAQLQYGVQSEWTGRLHQNIGTVYFEQDDFEKSLEHLSTALSIYKTVYGDNHFSVAAIHNTLGSLFKRKGEFEKAIENLQTALLIRESILGENHPEVANSYNNIGEVFDKKGDYKRAIEYYQKAISIFISINQENHPYMAGFYNNIGVAYDHQGNYEKTLEYYQAAQSIWESIYGKRHPHTAILYSNIGSTYLHLNNYDLALQYFETALTIQKSIFGEKHHDVANSYNNIALVCFNQGKYDKALPYFEIALNTWKSVYGTTHPDVAVCLNNIGLYYVIQKDYNKALEYYNQALSIWMVTYGESHPIVAKCYNEIGAVYYNQNSFADALEYYNKALNIYLALYGENHPEVVSDYNNIGTAYDRLGEYQKALEYLDKAVKTGIVVFGENHPNVATSYHSMGAIYFDHRNYEKALENYNNALSIFESTLEVNRPTVIQLQNNIIITKYFQSIANHTVETFCEDVCFTATVISGTPASQQGMSGEYILLEYADWNQDSPTSLFDKNNELRGKPKNILVMKDGHISQYHFENTIGVQMGVKYIGKEEKRHINKTYQEWKKQNKQ